MLPFLQVLLIIITLFESFKGETDHLTYKLATKPPQVSNWESPRYFTRYRSSEKSQTCSNTSDCLTWFVCRNGIQPEPECRCGPRYENAIICNKTMMILAVVECYCITEVDGKTYAGSCFYNCGKQTLKDKYTNIYHIISDKKRLE